MGGNSATQIVDLVRGGGPSRIASQARATAPTKCTMAFIVVSEIVILFVF
jgi:hypothetical protein